MSLQDVKVGPFTEADGAAVKVQWTPDGQILSVHRCSVLLCDDVVGQVGTARGSLFHFSTQELARQDASLLRPASTRTEATTTTTGSLSARSSDAPSRSAETADVVGATAGVAALITSVVS